MTSSTIAAKRADAVSQAAFNRIKASASSEALSFNNDGTIKQTERLFTSRPRYAPVAASGNGSGTSSVKSGATNQAEVYSRAPAARGVNAYIKLVTTSEGLANKYGSQRGVREFPELTGPGSIGARMSSTDSASGYDGFLLTSVSCQLQEKLQVTEVFGDGEVVYYFGRQPMMFSISGVLIDSPDNSWFTDWLKAYSGILRGSQLAQNHELLRLVLPNMTLLGTIASTSWQQDASSDTAIQFSFQFLAKRMEPTAPVLQNVTDSQLGNLIDFGKASDFIGQQAINSFKNQIASLESIIKSPLSNIAQIGSAMSTIGSGIGGGLSGILGGLSGASNSVKSWASTNGFSQTLSSTAAMFKSLSANLNGIRSQLFSPIYGILTSLTKLVRNASGDVNSIFNSLFSPVQNILRDITNISNQAVSLVNLVNSSIRGVGRNINRQIGATQSRADVAAKALGRAAGSIATSPQTVMQSLQDMFKNGAISYNAAFLQENKKASLSGSASVSGGSASSDYKIAILRSAVGYTPQAGAKL